MNTCRKKVVLYVVANPIDHPDATPNVYAQSMYRPASDAECITKTMTIELDVPLRYEQIPVTDVKEVL